MPSLWVLYFVSCLMSIPLPLYAKIHPIIVLNIIFLFSFQLSLALWGWMIGFLHLSKLCMCVIDLRSSAGLLSWILPQDIPSVYTNLQYYRSQLTCSWNAHCPLDPSPSSFSSLSFGYQQVIINVVLHLQFTDSVARQFSNTTESQ